MDRREFCLSVTALPLLTIPIRESEEERIARALAAEIRESFPKCNYVWAISTESLGVRGVIVSVAVWDITAGPDNTMRAKLSSGLTDFYPIENEKTEISQIQKLVRDRLDIPV